MTWKKRKYYVWWNLKFLRKEAHVFDKDCQFLNLTKFDEDFVNYAGIFNGEFVKFKLKELWPDIFNCLIFVQGLFSSKDAESCFIITNIEQDLKFNLTAKIKERDIV